MTSDKSRVTGFTLLLWFAAVVFSATAVVSYHRHPIVSISAFAAAVSFSLTALIAEHWVTHRKPDRRDQP